MKRSGERGSSTTASRICQTRRYCMITWMVGAPAISVAHRLWYSPSLRVSFLPAADIAMNSCGAKSQSGPTVAQLSVHNLILAHHPAARTCSPWPWLRLHFPLGQARTPTRVRLRFHGVSSADQPSVVFVVSMFLGSCSLARGDLKRADIRGQDVIRGLFVDVVDLSC